MYNHITDEDLLDVRDINTRRREGILFHLPIQGHYKSRQDPLIKAMTVWNNLPVAFRDAETKNELRLLLKNSIQNPYKELE